MNKKFFIFALLTLNACASGNSMGNGQVIIRHGTLTSFGTVYNEAIKSCGTGKATFVGKVDGNHTIFNCH